MDLPDRAKAMYKTWWSFVSYAASATGPIGQFLYTLTDAAAAASDIAKNIAGAFASWDPIGLSQLFSAARNIANVSKDINSSTDDRSTATLSIPEAPWSRATVDQLAAPSWQSRTLATYINEVGDQVQEYFQPVIENVLPGTVGDLKSQVAASIDNMLTMPTGQGTPRRGQLISVDSITLMVV
jgi:hypothetical protein